MATQRPTALRMRYSRRPGRGVRFQEGRWDGDVQREGGRQRRDEGCVQQPARHVAQLGHGVPVPRTGCPPRSSYPRQAGPD